MHKRGVVGYSKKSALLEEAITYMNAGKYGRSATALKELLALDPHNTEARRLFATLHVRLGSLVTARQAFESLANEAIVRQDFWLAESLLREYLAAGPRCVPFLELLAHVYEEKGDTMAAVAELGKAIDILIEDPDSEHSTKPSQLYAKVRELAPASSVAFQFASLFDIQTGEFLRPHPVLPPPVTSREVDVSQPQAEILATTEEFRLPDVMPWEEFDGATPSLETPLSTSSNPVIESLNVPDVLIDPTSVDPAVQELRDLPSELTDPILKTDPPGQANLASVSGLASPESNQECVPILAEPALPSRGYRDDGIAAPVVERSSFSDEGPTPNSSVERTADVGTAIMPSSGSPGLSSPMPWEQIENSTIRIEETPPDPPTPSEEAPLFGGESVPALSATAASESPSDQLESSAYAPGVVESGDPMLEDFPTSPATLLELEVPTLPAIAESVSDLLEWPAFGQRLAEPGEPMPGDLQSIPAVLPEAEVSSPSVTAESALDQVESSDSACAEAGSSDSTLGNSPTSPAVLPETEVPAPSVAESFSTIPFSWSTIFDGVWKFAIGNSSPSSPGAFSKPDAITQDARELGSIPAEFTTEPDLSVPLTPSTPEQLLPLIDPEPLPSAHLSILCDGNESIVEPVSISEPDSAQSGTVLSSEEPSRSETLSISSSDIPNSFQMDLPVPALSEPVEPARESEPVSCPSFMELPLAAPLPEASSLEPPLSAIIPDAPSAPEPVSTEHDEPAVTLFHDAVAVSLSKAPSDASLASPTSTDIPSHWSTGEVEVQPHRPSEKKRNWDKEKGEAAVLYQSPSPLREESIESAAQPSGGWESDPSESVDPVIEAVAPVVEQVVPPEDTRPEWVRASESITFVNMSPASSEPWRDSNIESGTIHSKPEPALSVAASAVDVLFDSTAQEPQARTQRRLVSPRPQFAARMARVRLGLSSLITSCFSTTRSIVLLSVGLALFCMALVAVGVAAVGMAWMIMEAPPSSTYNNLTTNPPRAVTDSRKNGYLMLLGFDAFAERDPMQAGYERKAEASDLQAASACMVGEEGKGMTTAGASANVIREWFTSSDPLGHLKQQGEAVRSWAAQESVALKRYQQWLPMTFEDVGYGQILSPNCAHILLVHRLYLAEGFAQDLGTGLQRLETDMGSWRVALGQAKTLMVKMLAAKAVQDDVAIASGLLTLQELDGAAISRLGKIVRPLDQVELSVRWPMQSHFVWATKTVTTSLKNDKAGERPLHVALAAAMPLPVQWRSNAYAEYYEAASKAVAEGRYTNLPKPSGFIRNPAVSVVDYLANPIENIIGIEPLPSWDPYVGRIVEIDARLRLASLQVWIRRGPQEGNVLTRLAKAGQAHYDPFTGLPILVNQQKGVMYSVGQDGKDQEGDPQRDIVATIPTAQSIVLESSRALSPPRFK
ncbi:MAG: tetratricopeptide repeat protein [Nitrospirota bacterium]